MEYLPLAIGIGLVVSLLFSEIFGLVAGGLVVPGYIALFLSNPLAVAVTLCAGVITFWIVHFISSFAIVYGKRRTVLMILVGYLIGALLRTLSIEGSPLMHAVEGPEGIVIGFIIPGLIANWLDRQGIIETFSTLLTASVVVRLVLVLLVRAELP